MRLCLKLCATAVLLAVPAAGHATSCTMGAALPSQDRNALVAAGGRLSEAVAQQDYTVLQAALLPAEASDWEGMRGAVEASAPLFKGGQVQLQFGYALDTLSLTAPADTQFFCSNASGSVTVTISMHAIPPGRYALVLANTPGTPLRGQMGILLAWDGAGATAGWKLAGLSMRPGVLEGSDGVEWWKRARELARSDQPWSAFFCYDIARYLLVPVDFLSSPNLEKLSAEQGQLKGSPQDAFPLSIPAGDRVWKIDSISLDPSLGHADLGVAFESTGVTDPAAQRTEAVAALSAVAKAHPALREAFHGMWAYAVKDGKRTPVMELPMAQIP
jgi:hypothetical protein